MLDVIPTVFFPPDARDFGKCWAPFRPSWLLQFLFDPFVEFVAPASFKKPLSIFKGFWRCQWFEIAYKIQLRVKCWELILIGKSSMSWISTTFNSSDQRSTFKGAQHKDGSCFLHIYWATFGGSTKFGRRLAASAAAPTIWSPRFSRWKTS